MRLPGTSRSITASTPLRCTARYRPKAEFCKIPNPNYFVPSSFGSLELRQRSGNEFIGQTIDYENTVNVRKLALDEFGLPRVDLIKLDVEGMELEALEGASRMIDRSHPIMLIEKIKTDAGKLRQWLEARGYRVIDVGINMLAVSMQTPRHTDPLGGEDPLRPEPSWRSHLRVSP